MLQRTFLLALMTVVLLLIGCEGAAGPEGPQGQQGPEGPVGPAGEDGSQMYAGTDTPAADIGQEGDYYLNTTTGEYYGPKDSNGWGNPIIVLMGEDGQDGADGEDGSQIYSGSGAPDASLGAEGDYYLNKDSYELYGPKTSSGWGMPLNLKGADGNANVTRYLFPAHDFSQENTFFDSIPFSNREDMRNNAWITYLVYDSGSSNVPLRYYHVPGYARGDDTIYSANHYWSDLYTSVFHEINAVEGPGEYYHQIEVIQVESNSTEDQTKQQSKRNIIPEELDLSNYREVAEYYGF